MLRLKSHPYQFANPQQRWLNVANFFLFPESLPLKPMQYEPQEQDLFLKCLLEANVDGIIAFDREYRYTTWNRAMERISGVKRAASAFQLNNSERGTTTSDGPFFARRRSSSARPCTSREAGAPTPTPMLTMGHCCIGCVTSCADRPSPSCARSTTGRDFR